MKRALITGITGQDGSYLAELLLAKGYEVHGLVRRASTFNRWRLHHVYKNLYNRNQRLFLEYGDLNDSSSIVRILQKVQPDEVYNLAAQSHVQVSFDTPEYTGNIDALGVLRLLEAMKMLGFHKHARFYQASTSELYGDTTIVPQNEETPFQPVSPYGVAKLYAYMMVELYRKAYGMFAVNGILFNHESPRRGENFVSKKIVQTLTRVKYGLQDTLKLGNLEAYRDWGYAKEYVVAMWHMLQQKEPSDYVIATGEIHSVREFVEETARYLNMDLTWIGTGREEKARDRNTKKIVVEIDDRYFRPKDVKVLQGDITKARRELKWEPTVKFKELIRLMVDYEVRAVEDKKHMVLIDSPMDGQIIET